MILRKDYFLWYIIMENSRLDKDNEIENNIIKYIKSLWISKKWSDEKVVVRDIKNLL